MAVVDRLVPLLLLGGLAGCAATTEPLPPPEERLLVVNAGENTLSLIPTEVGRASRKIMAPGLRGGASDISAMGRIAIVSSLTTDSVAVFDLRLEDVRDWYTFPAGSQPSAVVLLSEEVAYVANAGSNTVTRLNLTTGDTASVEVGQYPRDLVLTRGRLFVVNANVESCPEGTCSLGESWITVVDPQTNARAAGRDSIPLPSPGNARSATLGGDGLIYIVSTGDTTSEVSGRLSIVDPIQRQEVGSFAGFGFVPWGVASDGAERLFVTSIRDGLMEFNTRTRRVVRGAGEGIFVLSNVAAAVDPAGRIYAIEATGCDAGQPGRLRVFRPDLTQARDLPLGVCPVAVTLVQLPGLGGQVGLTGW